MRNRISFVAARLNGSLLIDVQGSVLCAGLKLASGAHSSSFVLPDGMDVVRASSAAFVGDDVITLDTNRGLVYQCGSFGRSKKPYRAFVNPRYPAGVKLVAANLLHQLAVTGNGKVSKSSTRFLVLIKREKNLALSCREQCDDTDDERNRKRDSVFSFKSHYDASVSMLGLFSAGKVAKSSAICYFAHL